MTLARMLNVAYHGEIGREATASATRELTATAAYHGEIGREATATRFELELRDLAYHGEIGREATALVVATMAEAISLPRGNR